MKFLMEFSLFSATVVSVWEVINPIVIKSIPFFICTLRSHVAVHSRMRLVRKFFTSQSFAAFGKFQ